MNPAKTKNKNMDKKMSHTEVIAKIDKALATVSALCQGEIRWTMRVPAEPDRDPDLIIASALQAAKAALTAPAQTAPSEPDRKLILLKAAYDLLVKQDQSSYVLNILATTAHWDDTECDGYCLMGEIKDILEDAGVEVAPE